MKAHQIALGIGFAVAVLMIIGWWAWVIGGWLANFVVMIALHCH